MLYDAFLSRGGAERRVLLPMETVLKPGDEFKVEREVYAVTSVQQGHDEFDAVLSADLIGDEPAFTAYRDQVARLLQLAEELLTEAERDSLRLAIKAQRENRTPLDEASPFLMPRAVNIGERIAAQLEEADQELSPEQVGKLERLVEDALPNI